MKTIKKPICPTGRLHAETVKHHLANTRQITLEVTDACNLRCMYCGVGDMYTTHDQRENRFLEFKKAINLINYVLKWKNSSYNVSLNKEITIGFYGGEPLLNMSLIRKIVDYVKTYQSEGDKRIINFYMTTREPSKLAISIFKTSIRMYGAPKRRLCCRTASSFRIPSPEISHLRAI